MTTARPNSPAMTAKAIHRIRVALAGTKGRPSRSVRNTARSWPTTKRASREHDDETEKGRDDE